MERIGLSICENVIIGRHDVVGTKVMEALEAGIPAQIILNDSFIAAKDEVGDRVERGDFYVPEMLIAARAMQAGLAILKPYLGESSYPSAGKVVIETVEGDLHDIGKNLVIVMLEGAGFEVIDLGLDVSAEEFVDAVREHAPLLVGMSALLTTTMQNMEKTIETFENSCIREQVKVIIGGASATEAFSKEIRADGYASDASRAVSLAKKIGPNMTRHRTFA
jgi:5-methyltetrahydrofolate--homocysteine methyltransferase